MIEPIDGAQAVTEYFRNVVAEIDQVDRDAPSAATHYCIAIRIIGQPDPWKAYGHEITADQFRAFLAERDEMLAENTELRSKLSTRGDLIIGLDAEVARLTTCLAERRYTCAAPTTR